MRNDFKVKVAEAHQDDVNSGIVRVDRQLLGKLGLNYGDIIGIAGERETLAVVDRAYPSDLGLEIIRMDGVIRKNAKTSVGENINLFKPELQEAKKVVLNPMTEFIPHQATLNNLKKNLLRKPVVSGDILCIKAGSGSGSRRILSQNNGFAIDIFNSIQDEFLGFNPNGAKFKVSVTKPAGFLFIGPNTAVEITNKTEDENESTTY